MAIRINLSEDCGKNFPMGLPSCLISEPNGYGSFCSLLELASQFERKYIYKKVPNEKVLKKVGFPIKPNLRTADRYKQRLTFSYCIPYMRISLWKKSYKKTRGFTKSKGLAKIISLEYFALESYNQKFPDLVVNEDELKDCNSFIEMKSSQEDWMTPALALLPFVYADLKNWDSFSQKRQRKIELAAFSISTILNDNRLLRWAAETIPDLKTEFDFVVNGMKDKNSTTPDDDQTTKDDSTENMKTSLQQLCHSLSNIALELGEGNYTEKLFDDISNYAEKIELLRRPLIVASETEIAESLITEFSEHLIKQEDRAPWLSAKANDIESAWRTVYFDMSEVCTDSDQIRANFETKKKKLEKCIEKWATAKSELTGCKDKLEDFQTQVPPLDDYSARIVHGEQEIKFLKAVKSAIKKESKRKQKVIDVAFPHEHKGSSDRKGDFNSSNKKEEPRVDDVRGKKSPEKSEPKEICVSGNGLPVTPVESTGTTISEEESHPVQHEVAIWEAIHDKRLGLAYHIALLRNQLFPNDELLPAPSLLAAVALGGFLYKSEGSVAREFGKHSQSVLSAEMRFVNLKPEVKDALNLLHFSASLLPALFAPQTGAIPMLQKIKLSGNLQAVYQFATAIAGHAQKLQTVQFDVPRLKSILDATVWEKRLEDNRQEVREWLALASNKSFHFESASKVWKYWLSSSGKLGELVKSISDDSIKSVQTASSIVELLKNTREVKSLAESTFSKIIQPKVSKGVHPQALRQLERQLILPLDLATDWLKIVKSKPHGGGYVESIVSDLHRDISNQAPNSIKEINEVRQNNTDLALTAALLHAQISIEALVKTFEKGWDSSNYPETLEVNRILNRDILFVCDLEVDIGGNIVKEKSIEDVLALLTDRDSHAESLDATFEQRIKLGFIAGAQATVEQMSFEKIPEVNLFREKLDKELFDLRACIEDELDELSEKLEQAFTRRRLPESELADLNDAIASTRDMCSYKEKVVVANEYLSSFRSKINGKFDAAIKSVENELNRYLPLNNSTEEAYVKEAIESRDLITLYEQLDHLKNGERLLPVEHRQISNFENFISRVEKIDEVCERHEGSVTEDQIQFLTQYENELELNYSSLTVSQRQRAENLLKLWYAMSRKESANQTNVHQFFDSLGFTVKKCIPLNYQSLHIVTEPLQSRELCPVSAFGSDANGHYEVILNWSASSQEKIVQSIGHNTNRCIIVLNFGRLNENRKWLRDWSIQNGVPFVAVDESLIVYLSSLRSSILRALFDCTLPFTCVAPFHTSAGLVPPESFYGREIERNSVMDRRGSCFVYGGRQLGKTALLRSVEASFHQPNLHRVAIFVDLKVHDVGVGNESAEHVWRVLWTEFEKHNVIKSKKRIPNGRNKLVDVLTRSIKEWLSEYRENRILLLLDEADAFLTSDVDNDFRESTRLKGLMDETDRRFKIVFSGLHNVLRTTEKANHPLAHFGKSICVGPLLSNGELEQARALIREPLTTIGCKFDSYSTSTHILTRTNYYPSLIQLCGAELVKYLWENRENQFPHVVTKNDIKILFSRDGLRDLIRERFSLTLQLDPRYEVITYVIALEWQSYSDRLSSGLPPNRILHLVRDWWPDGFKISQHEFNSLLDEMCGLGVLRIHQAQGAVRKYSIRNPNIMLILGNSDEIVQVLCKDRELPEVFEASTYHAQYPKGIRRQNPSPKRGPLSYEQESMLRRRAGVTVITGSDTTNIKSVGEFLSQRMDQRTFSSLKFCTGVAELERQLGRRRPSSRSVHVYMVPIDAPWSIEWIERVVVTLNRTKIGKFMQVVFIADPSQLWSFAGDLFSDNLEGSNGMFSWINLHPWKSSFLRRWCSDQSLQVAKPQVDELLELTGGWPSILERHAESIENQSPAKKQATRNYIKENRLELLIKLGLGEEDAKEHIILLQEYKAFTPEEARQTASLIRSDNDGTDLDEDKLVRRLFWGKHLGLIQEIEGNLQLNSLVKQLLFDSD